MGQELLQSPLTKAQESLLAHRPYYAVTSPYSSNGVYIMAVGKVCQIFNPRVAEEATAEAL